MTIPEATGPAAAAPINLRAERRRRGKSIRRQAEEIGVSARVLDLAEKGSTPHPANQRLIAEFYGVDVVLQWPEPDADLTGVSA